MKKQWNWRVLKIAGILFAIFLVLILGSLYWFVRPLSDREIRKKFDKTAFRPEISYKNYQDHQIRIISMQKQIDTTLPVLVFVHGSPGSAMDFFRYLSDPDLNRTANLLAYDRIGYSKKKEESAVDDLRGEVAVLHTVVAGIPNGKVVLLGYSYGGTVVMADPAAYRAKIALAPSVKGEYEPQFWLLNFYKWKFTRPLIPRIFQNAAGEKLRHLNELPQFENKWTLSKSPVTVLHGNDDRIVPYQNSVFLKEIFPSDRFELITIDGGTHALVWTDFTRIREEILKVLKTAEL